MRFSALLLLPALALPALPLISGSAQEPARRPLAAEQELFFAVLEGLYRDGVDNEIVDRVLTIDPKSGYPELFVYACPICMPSYDAFLVYRARAKFYGRKFDADTFGGGLDAATRARFLSSDRDTRWTALNQMVERYVARRLDDLQLSERERSDFHCKMEEMRKKGMSMLYSYQSDDAALYYPGMKACALCDAANSASE